SPLAALSLGGLPRADTYIAPGKPQQNAFIESFHGRPATNCSTRRCSPLSLVEIGAIELHPWNCTVDDIEHPDMIVFDLDPGEKVEGVFVRDTALKLRELLDAEGLDTWPKLTGGKGIHVMVPIERGLTHDEAHAYARDIAERLAGTAPDRYTTNAALAKR